MARAGLACLSLVVALGCDVTALDVLGQGPDAPVDAGTEPGRGALVRYLFDEGAGARVLDSSGSDALVHLEIRDPARVTWLDGALRVDAPTEIASAGPPVALVDACRRSNALTVEAWVRPDAVVVDGTHRIVTLSESPSLRNFTVGQGDLSSEPSVDQYVLRLRTTGTSDNGLPALETGPGVVEARLVHLVATHAADGREVLWIDGDPVAEGDRSGDFSNWSAAHRLALVNELDPPNDARSWLGELHFVAVYDRAFPPDEVAARFTAGPE